MTMMVPSQLSLVKIALWSLLTASVPNHYFWEVKYDVRHPACLLLTRRMMIVQSQFRYHHRLLVLAVYLMVVSGRVAVVDVHNRMAVVVNYNNHTVVDIQCEGVVVDLVDLHCGGGIVDDNPTVLKVHRIPRAVLRRSVDDAVGLANTLVDGYYAMK